MPSDLGWAGILRDRCSYKYRAEAAAKGPQKVTSSLRLQERQPNFARRPTTNATCISFTGDNSSVWHDITWSKPHPD